MILWRIYYDDDSTYSNVDGPWVDAPKHGVVCIVVRCPIEDTWGRWIISGWSPIKKGRGNPDLRYLTEWFVKYPDDEEPYATNDTAPFIDRMQSLGVDPEPYIKYGRECSQECWQETMKRAREDKDFPIGQPRRRSTDK